MVWNFRPGPSWTPGINREQLGPLSFMVEVERQHWKHHTDDLWTCEDNASFQLSAIEPATTETILPHSPCHHPTLSQYLMQETQQDPTQQIPRNSLHHRLPQQYLKGLLNTPRELITPLTGWLIVTGHTHSYVYFCIIWGGDMCCVTRLSHALTSRIVREFIYLTLPRCFNCYYVLLHFHQCKDFDHASCFCHLVCLIHHLFLFQKSLKHLGNALEYPKDASPGFSYGSVQINLEGSVHSGPSSWQCTWLSGQWYHPS